MNAIPLHLADGRPAGVFYCGTCRTVALSQAHAEHCCQPFRCPDCQAVMEQVHYPGQKCPACAAARARTHQAKQYAAATKLTEYTGWVYDGNEFHENLDEFLEYLVLNPDIPRPAYVWATTPVKFVNIDFETIVANVVDGEAPDDWEMESLAGVAEFKAAIDAFNAANAHHLAYHPDHSRAVLLPPPDVHDHTCNCGTATESPHETATCGCLRRMAEAPEPLPNDYWRVDGHEITGFTLREQRLYHQHPCGCWSRATESSNSIEA